MMRILIVEDDPDIAMGLQDDLTREGYQTEIAADGETALLAATGQALDLILLDVMLPRLDGFEVCRRMRRMGVRTPVIILTARSQETEKVIGLELGADDYVTKPFSPRELRARIQAVLRRASGESAGSHRFGEIEIDFDRAEVRRSGVPVDVTPLELRLLRAFVGRRGRALSRSQLIEAAWEGAFVTDRVVDTHVMNLRRKIEPDPGNPRFIRGVRGIGYRFDG